jgi:hypothetical protein
LKIFGSIIKLSKHGTILKSCVFVYSSGSARHLNEVWRDFAYKEGDLLLENRLHHQTNAKMMNMANKILKS